MKSSHPYAIHTIKAVLENINHCDDDDQWIAIGNFLNDWWYSAKDHRNDLISESPTEHDIQLQPQWAAFCAATVEELCIRTSFPCPTWVNQSVYFLKEPWILPSAPDQSDAKMLQPFQRRNIFVGSNVIDNKYELRYKYPQQASKFTPWSEEEVQRLIKGA
jgi:hypothetical protein